jgi:xylose isomerase
MRNAVTPAGFSIGGWCGINPGGDPFGDAVRNIGMDEFLGVLGTTAIKRVSFHDRDLWPDDAAPGLVTDVIGHTKERCAAAGVEVYNFTSNNFSNPCFRSGAFSSPFPQVRAAAIVKGCNAVDNANEFGAKHVIWWGGREGSDGAYEQDPGLGLARYMQGLKICVRYGLEKGFNLIHTIEPKVYEPRLLALYAGTGASAASAIRYYFNEPAFAGRVLVNPEYPQHVMMVNLDPVFELGQLLEEGMLAPFIHFGGQIAGRMDCDLPPGFGSNVYTDFMIVLTLNRRGWNGVVEFDCRPPRTTTSCQGLTGFLNGAVGYWRMLEDKVAAYFADPQIADLENALMAAEDSTVAGLLAASSVTSGVSQLRAAFKGFRAAADVNTDVIEAYQRRVMGIITGTAK